MDPAAPPARPAPKRPSSTAPGAPPSRPAGEPTRSADAAEASTGVGSEVNSQETGKSDADVPPPPVAATSPAESVKVNKDSDVVASNVSGNEETALMDDDDASTDDALEPTVSIFTELSDPGSRKGNKDDKSNLPNSDFTRSARKRLEVPSELLDRTLLVGEEVVGEFDYYYPTKKVMKSVHTHIKLSIMSLGLYILWHCLKWFGRQLVELIGIEGNVANYRGKMFATNKGRLIFWRLRASQYRWFNITGRAFYDVADIVTIMNVGDIRETTVRFARQPSFLCFLQDTKASLEVVFNSFPYDRSEYSKSFFTSPAKKFLDAVNYCSGSFQSFYEVDVFSDGRRSRNTKSKMPCAQAMVLRLVSKDGDRANSGADVWDHGLKSFDSILSLNKQLSSLIEREEVFTAGFDDHYKRFETADELFDFSIVGEHNEVTIPLKYIPLNQGERIISTVGTKYETTINDYILSIITLGWYWYNKLSIRQLEHTANVLTNHRIIEINVNAPKGFVPNSFAKACKIRVRSIYPGEVYSGYIKNDGKDLTSALLATGGCVCLTLPIGMESAFFAQAMQSVKSRQKLLLDTNLVPELHENEIERKSHDYSHHTSSNELSGHTVNLPLETCQLLPLMYGEKAIHYYETLGKKSLNGPADGGRLIITDRTVMRINRLKSPKIKDINESEQLKLNAAKHHHHHSHKTKDKRQSNADGRGHSLTRAGKFNSDKNAEPYFLLWIPAKDVCGHTLDIHSSGGHPVNWCCSYAEWKGVTYSYEKYCLRIQTSMGFSLPFDAKTEYSDDLYSCKIKQGIDAPYVENQSLRVVSRILGLIGMTQDVVEEKDDNTAGNGNSV